MHAIRHINLILLGLCLLATKAGGETVRAHFADSVYVNGNIYIGNVKNPWVSQLAVRDGLYSYVGEDASALVGPKTVVYDLDELMAIPGIIDGHTHIGLVALSNTLVEMEVASTKQELLSAVRKLVHDNADRKVIIGGYWANDIFGEQGPHKKLLDAIEPDRPVILYDELTHSVWANSIALSQAGVTRDTPDVVPGFSFYQKDEHGEPSGWITESAASLFINNFQSVTPQVVDAMLEYMNYFKSMGVTTVLDAGNFGLDNEVFAAISRLDQAGKLPVRYHGAYTLFTPQALPTAVQRLQALADRYNSDNVRIDTLKVFYDGVVDTRTAAMLADYHDTPGNSGEILLSRENIHGLILELDEAGFNLHVHVVGDRATKTLLDAIEDAHRSLQREPSIRITLCHVEFVEDPDFARFKDLAVVANFTPHWAVGGDLSWYEAGIGELAFDMQRAQPLLSDGAVVSFSSDNTTESEWKSDRGNSNPYVGMQVGHTRQDVGMGEDAPILPPVSERLQMDDLINGYTSGGAYQLGRSDIGSISVGKRADLVVLNQNLFSVDAYEIHKTQPIAVIMDGQIVEGSLPLSE